MDRRTAESSEALRFRVDPTRCDGQGVCVLVAPELFALDRYGLSYVVPGSEDLVTADPDVRARGLEADALCPRDAIYEEPVNLFRPAPVVQVPTSASAPSRLLLDVPESVTDWRERGGWGSHDGAHLLDLVEQAGIDGQGGASFPTATKWRRVAGNERPVVVLNGAEREPGTVKDRHLLAHRPGLVLDGLRLAMRAVGAQLALIAVDEEAVTAYDAMQAAIDEATEIGLFEDCEISIHKVPTRYVAGEETALISLLDGGPAVPRLRPPLPADIGMSGRPTLVQNVETLAQVALAATLGADQFRAVGTETAPGTGLFSLGPFGGPYHVLERPFGYSLRELLAEAELLEDVRAVLVGGYAGGLLTPDSLDIALTPAALNAAGASLGTKSVQVIGSDQCPVGAVAEIVGYFGAETANQCPPCFRGLPDMADLLRRVEAGTGGRAAVDDLEQFMGTLFGRGVCRLPDGAARVALSLLTYFREDVEEHAVSGCPLR